MGPRNTGHQMAKEAVALASAARALSQGSAPSSLDVYDGNTGALAFAVARVTGHAQINSIFSNARI
jgi:hypothetical protein